MKPLTKILATVPPLLAGLGAAWFGYSFFFGREEPERILDVSDIVDVVPSEDAQTNAMSVDSSHLESMVSPTRLPIDSSPFSSEDQSGEPNEVEDSVSAAELGKANPVAHQDSDDEVLYTLDDLKEDASEPFPRDEASVLSRVHERVSTIRASDKSPHLLIPQLSAMRRDFSMHNGFSFEETMRYQEPVLEAVKEILHEYNNDREMLEMPRNLYWSVRTNFPAEMKRSPEFWDFSMRVASDLEQRVVSTLPPHSRCISNGDFLDWVYATIIVYKGIDAQSDIARLSAMVAGLPDQVFLNARSDNLRGLVGYDPSIEEIIPLLPVIDRKAASARTLALMEEDHWNPERDPRKTVENVQYCMREIMARRGLSQHSHPDLSSVRTDNDYIKEIIFNHQD